MSETGAHPPENGLDANGAVPAKRIDGCYRRRVIALVGPGVVEAGVEDDFHHFRVTVRHDGTHVSSVEGEPLRYPWATCPGASDGLEKLRGAPISTAMTRHPDAFDRFHQCTHQLELALFAIAQAARGVSRRYDLTIADSDDDGLCVATVERDGETVETWRIKGEQLITPPELAQMAVRSLRPWAEALDDDRYERVAMLRRCLQVAAGRKLRLRPDLAAEVPGARNACYAFQDARSRQGVFIRESVRDFSAGADGLLATSS